MKKDNWKKRTEEKKKFIGLIIFFFAVIFSCTSGYFVVTGTIFQTTGRFTLPKETVIGQLIAGMAGLFFAVSFLIFNKPHSKKRKDFLMKIESREEQEKQRNFFILMLILMTTSYFLEGAPKRSSFISQNMGAGILINIMFAGLTALSFGCYMLVCFIKFNREKQ